jgi:hypothetical protein
MLPAGTYYLEVKLQGSTVLDTTATVASGGNYTVIAHLLEGSGIDLAVFENDASPARRGAPRVTVRHAADAPGVDVGPKPLRSRKSLGPFGPAQNGEELGPLNVRPGRYTAEVFAAGTTDLVAALPVSLRPFTGYTVYAVGSLEDGTFQFLVQQQKLPSHRHCSIARSFGEGFRPCPDPAFAIERTRAAKPERAARAVPACRPTVRSRQLSFSLMRLSRGFG